MPRSTVPHGSTVVIALLRWPALLEAAQWVTDEEKYSGSERARVWTSPNSCACLTGLATQPSTAGSVCVHPGCAPEFVALKWQQSTL